MSKKFQKKVENFVCEKCGREVIGSGFTNHCPACLWSKHVDNNPGDREAVCQGLMEPVRIEQVKAGYDIVYRCVKCAIEKKNRVQSEDDFDVVLAVVKKANAKFSKMF